MLTAAVSTFPLRGKKFFLTYGPQTATNTPHHTTLHCTASHTGSVKFVLKSTSEDCTHQQTLPHQVKCSEDSACPLVITAKCDSQCKKTPAQIQCSSFLMHRCTTKKTRGKACKEREVPPVLYARHTRRHTTIGTDDPTPSHQTMIWCL